MEKCFQCYTGNMQNEFKWPTETKKFSIIFRKSKVKKRLPCSHDFVVNLQDDTRLFEGSRVWDRFYSHFRFGLSMCWFRHKFLQTKSTLLDFHQGTAFDVLVNRPAFVGRAKVLIAITHSCWFQAMQNQFWQWWTNYSRSVIID